MTSVITYALAACAAAVLPSAVLARPFSFQYVTGLHSTPDAVSPTRLPPAFDGQTIAFHGFDYGTVNQGIFTFPLGGSVQTVVHNGDPSPGGGTYFTITDPPSISNGAVAFHAATTIGRGVFSNAGGTVQAVIGPGFADLPDGGRSSRWGRRPEIQNGTVLYSASGDNTSAFGVFSWTPNGGGRTVVDASTPNPVNPGRPLFPYSLYPVLHDGLVGVVSFGNPGIFVADPDGHIVQTVATDTTMAPGGSVNFTTFGSAPIDLGQGSVLFEGRSGVTDGLYTTLGGALRLVASTNTPIPGGQGNFMPFDTTTTEFALSSAGVVFTGMGSGTQRGIYGDFSGALVRVLAVGDTLDGRLVSDVFVGRDGLVGDRLVFTVFFTDDQSAVYIVTVPAPSAAFAVGGLGVWCTRRRRAVA